VVPTGPSASAAWTVWTALCRKQGLHGRPARRERRIGRGGPKLGTAWSTIWRCKRPLGRQLAEAPERSTYFLEPDSSYTNWLPREGTNALVKQFLYAGEPDSVVFESRLQRVMASTETGKLLPLFDRGGLQASYSAVVLAMPPKDILKFFAHENSGRHEPQSQADLHRRTNRGRSAQPLDLTGHRHVALPADVQRRLGAPSYVGRYSLALWFDETESETASFLSRLAEAWRERRGPNPTIDLVSHQPGGVVVVQSTVQFWRRPEAGRPGSPHGASRDAGRGRGRGEGRGGRGGGRGQGKGQGGGGGRDAAKAGLVAALEDLAGGPMPRARNAKLLNWRTSQVDRALAHGGEDGATVDVVTAEGGRLIFTGDWCTESSFEGCNRAALAAAAAAKDVLTHLLQPPPSTPLPTPPANID